VKQGESGDKFYIILKGTVMVSICSEIKKEKVFMTEIDEFQAKNQHAKEISIDDLKMGTS
jgi:CRP-like cAMP-binding protein